MRAWVRAGTRDDQGHTAGSELSPGSAQCSGGGVLLRFTPSLHTPARHAWPGVGQVGSLLGSPAATVLSPSLAPRADFSRSLLPWPPWGQLLPPQPRFCPGRSTLASGSLQTSPCRPHSNGLPCTASQGLGEPVTARQAALYVLLARRWHPGPHQSVAAPCHGHRPTPPCGLHPSGGSCHSPPQKPSLAPHCLEHPNSYR